MRILITGGAGYVGARLVKQLSLQPDVSKIIIYDNLMGGNHNLFLGDKFVHPEKVEFIFGDILDSRKLKKILQGVDIVYHLAAKVTSPFANVNLHYYEQINNWGTAELVYAIEESSVQKVIYMSSMGVYGFSDEILDENSEPNPMSFYAISKQRGEQHMQRLSESVNTIILRCGNVYGYGRSMRFDAVINKFVFEANFNKRISINGNGNQHRAFINIQTLAEVIAQAAMKEMPSGIYNLSERNMTIIDIVDALKEIIPELEFLFINQQLNFNQQRISEEQKLKKYIPYGDTGFFKEEMKRFVESFSF